MIPVGEMTTEQKKQFLYNPDGKPTGPELDSFPEIRAGESSSDNETDCQYELQLLRIIRCHGNSR